MDRFIQFTILLSITIILTFVTAMYPNKETKQPRGSLLALWGIFSLCTAISFYRWIGFNLSRQIKDFTIFTQDGKIDWEIIIKIAICVIIISLIKILAKRR